MKTFFWKKPAKRLIAALLALILLSNAACLPGVELTPLVTPTGTETLLPTETIVWFPPTATWTPFPTPQPTATTEPFPGMGAQIFADDFTDPPAWTNSQTASGGGNDVVITGGRLILVANLVPVTLNTIRSGLLLTDFYAQTEVSINRCSGKDAYGMLFRAASEAYTYRYLLTCNGQMRVERVRGGEAYPLSNWELSGDIPSGLPGQVKIGLWVAGAEMRFFLNDRYQFTVFDPIFKSGSLGYIASAASEIGMNISFSNLTVNAVSYVSPTPTSTPSKTPLPSRTPRPTP